MGGGLRGGGNSIFVVCFRFIMHEKLLITPSIIETLYENYLQLTHLL